MSDWYYLKNRKIVPFGCDIMTDPRKYTKLYHKHFKNNRKIRVRYFSDYWVSTVFLGLDHSFNDGEPLVFETMIFPKNSSTDEHCFRCSTHRQALKQHQMALKIGMAKYET